MHRQTANGGVSHQGIEMTDVVAFDWTMLPTRRDLLDRIERLDVSADAKLVLANIATVTMEVGGRIVEAGRRIVAFAFELAKSFPNTIFGLIVALILSSLIASIPLLGGMLGALLAPLLLAYGLGSGAMQDLKDGALRRRVTELESEFRTITA